MKQVIRKKADDVVHLQDVDKEKIYIFKNTDNNKWFKIDFCYNCGYIANILHSSNCRLCGDSKHYLSIMIEQYLDKNYPVYEFNTLKEMIDFLNIAM